MVNTGLSNFLLLLMKFKKFVAMLPGYDLLYARGISTHNRMRQSKNLFSKIGKIFKINKKNTFKS